MKVFVAGASGVAGRPAVAAMVAAGHEVTGLARSEQRASLLTAAGARAARVELFDVEGLTKALAGTDAVVNLATHIPHLGPRALLASTWAEDKRIRTEGSRCLVDAALAAGVGGYVQESLAWLHADAGDAWVVEGSALDPVAAQAPVVAAAAQAERFAAAGGTAVVLRFGQFYGPDSHTTQALLDEGRRGRPVLLGHLDAWWSYIHTDDVGSAVAAAVAAPGGTYLVAGDPCRRSDLSAALAPALGVDRLRHQPSAISLIPRLRPLARSLRVSSASFAAVTGWAPARPDACAGWVSVAGG